MKKKNFILAGVGGYIAPRHLFVLSKIKANLLASYDLNDSVGIIDRYFPNSNFFNKEKDFTKYIIKNKKKIDYLIICLPNFLRKLYLKVFELLYCINYAIKYSGKLDYKKFRKQRRGMNFLENLDDWIGGYPYEYS